LTTDKYPQSFDGLLQKFAKYKVAIVSLALIIGFVYVQGLFSPVTDSKFSLANLFLATNNLPIPLDNYISNGMVFLFSLFFQIVIAYIIYLLFSNVIKKLPGINPKLLRNNVDSSSKKIPELLAFFLAENSFWVLPGVFAAFVYYLQINNLFSRPLERFELQQYTASLSFTLLWIINIIYIIIILGSFSLSKLHLSNLLTNNVVEKDIYKVKKAAFIIVVILSSMFMVYYNGFLTYHIKVQRALEEKGGFDFVKVYFKKDSGFSPLGCYRVYMTDKYFIGYIENTKKIILFPCDIITKVEKWHIAENADKKNRYIPISNSTTTQALDALTPEQQAATAVENFYRYRTGWLYNERVGEIDSIKLFTLLSKKLQQGSSFNIDPKLFANRANMIDENTQSNIWKGKKLTQFCGFELVVPNPLDNNKYEVNVFEVWKDFDEFSKFTIIKENGEWRIDEITENAKPFIFIDP